MKVLQVCKYYYPFIGGIENHARLLTNELHRNAINITVLTSNTSWRTKIDSVNGVSVIRTARLLNGFATPFSPSLPLWLGRLSTDIVHIHLVNPMAELAYLLACPSGTLVVSYHLDVTRNQRLFQIYKPIMLGVLERARYIICGSPSFARSSPYLQAFQDKCVVVPYSIDLSEFNYTSEVASQSQKIRSRFGSPIVLFVGRLTHYKGLTYLLEATRHIEAHLLVIGDGDLMADLLLYTQELDIVEKVTFLGEVQGNIAPYYHACDVLVLPSISRAESFGQVQLEAHACAKPVVCTELGTGTSFVNRHEETGFVVEPRSSEALVRAINTLLNSEELRLRFGNAGRKIVEQEFTKEQMAQRVLAVYEKVLAEGK